MELQRNRPLRPAAVPRDGSLRRNIAFAGFDLRAPSRNSFKERSNSSARLCSKRTGGWTALSSIHSSGKIAAAMHSSDANALYRVHGLRPDSARSLAAENLQGSFSSMYIVREP
jgi:hypothetical protein